MATTPPALPAPSGLLERFKSIPSGGKGYESGQQCGVCLGRFSVSHAGSLACGHTFCHLCLIKLLKVVGSDVGQRACPLCRGPLDGLPQTGIGSTLLYLKQHVKCLDCGKKDVPNDEGLFCNTCVKTLCKNCVEEKHKKDGNSAHTKDEEKKCDVVPFSKETALKLYLNFLEWQTTEFSKSNREIGHAYNSLRELFSSDEFWERITPVIISCFREGTADIFKDREENINRQMAEWGEYCAQLSTTMGEIFKGIIPEENELGGQMKLCEMEKQNPSLSDMKDLREKVERSIFRNVFPFSNTDMLAKTDNPPQDPAYNFADFLDVSNKRKDRLYYEIGQFIHEKMYSEFRYVVKYNVLQSGFLSHINDWENPPPEKKDKNEESGMGETDISTEMGEITEEGGQSTSTPEPIDTAAQEHQENSESTEATVDEKTSENENVGSEIPLGDQGVDDDGPNTENDATADNETAGVAENTSVTGSDGDNDENESSSASSDESDYDQDSNRAFDSDCRSAVLMSVAGMAYNPQRESLLLTTSGQRLFVCELNHVEYGRCIQTAPFPWSNGLLRPFGQIAISAQLAFIASPDDGALLVFNLGSWTLRTAIKLPVHLLPVERIHAGPSYTSFVYILSAKELVRISIKDLCSIPCPGTDGPQTPQGGLIENVFNPLKGEFKDFCLVPSKRLILVSENPRKESAAESSDSSDSESEYYDVFRPAGGQKAKNTYKIHFIDSTTLTLQSSEEDFFYRRSAHHRNTYLRDRLRLAADATGEWLFLSDFWDYSSEIRAYELGRKKFIGKVMDLCDRPAQLLPVGRGFLYVLESPDDEDTNRERSLFWYKLKSEPRGETSNEAVMQEFEPDNKPGNGENRLWE